MRLVQITNPTQGRKVALVEESQLLLLDQCTSIYHLALEAIERKVSMRSLIRQYLSTRQLPYDNVYGHQSSWKLLPCFDHPSDPLHCMLSGTGLTHKASAENRQQMHKAQEDAELTDSMKMYLMGVEGGRPSEGQAGVQPEWFYKGNGSLLRAHGESLQIPEYGNDGGEEPEIAGVYVNDKEGKPWRIGLTTANEFSDHVMERQNYLYLAPSKIRNCSIGPELVIDAPFQNLTGKVSVVRAGKTLWEKPIKSGEENMAHSLANLEYHHFKYANHRIPGQAHVHFFGADAFSFGEQVELADGDIMEVYWEGMGRPLRNRLAVSGQEESVFQVKQLS